MIGFIVGTLCLFGLIRLLAFRRYRHLMHHGYGYGPFAFAGAPFARGHAGYGYGPAFGRGHWSPRRFGGYAAGAGFGRTVFAQLDTTPGQEKAIAQAVDALREHMKGSRDELRAARKGVAAAIGGDVLDEAALEAALARAQAVSQAFARALSRVLADVHTALDVEQRARLSELIADDANWRGFAPRHWA
jgi:Spy/CpxP family protein refolding chaperone